MAQTAVPYPYPNYNSDLLAKEIVNGTYYASIKMLLKNSKTGEDRYVNVPDSPDIIEKMESGQQVKEVVEQNVSNTPIYNRDKMLEDAILPKYVNNEEDLPIIVSYAQTPQSLSYAGNQQGTLYPVARFDDGNKKFFVGVETTDTKNTDTESDDIRTFFKFKGTNKTAMFTVDMSKIYVSWLYSVGGRNFFSSGTSIYEYTETGYTKLVDIENSTVKLPFILMDGNNFYAVVYHNSKLFAINVDTGKKISTDLSSMANDKYEVSAFSANIFYAHSFLAEVKDGKISIKEKYKDWEHSNIKVRFEYLDNNLVTKYNIRHGHPKYVKSKRPSSRQEEFLGLKEGYISIENGVLFYTPDYKSYVSSGISVKNNAKIAICSDYIYLYEANRLVIVSVNKWSTKIPSSRYAELYAKNKMLDNQNPIPRIGD